MVAEKVTTEDVKNIGAGGKLEVILPNYAAIEAAKVLVTRVKLRYPREDGYTLRTSFNRKKMSITIYCEPKVEEEE